MVYLRSLARPAAVAGVIALSGLAAAPALAYPPGANLTIACTPTVLAPSATFTCTLENTNPAGPTDIVIGGLVSSGEGVSLALASMAAQDGGTYTETFTAPTTLGTYEMIGTSADETATTTIQVVAGDTGGGQPSIPDTGGNVTLGLVAGLGALGLGGGLYAARRRKKI